MKRIMVIVSVLAFVLLPLLASAEVRTYTEMVTIKIEDDELSALNKAKERAKEMALQHYLNDVYKERSATLNLTGNDSYFSDLEVVESKIDGGGFFGGKELKAKVRVVINEEAVRDYLNRQGAVTGKNEEKRIFVLLIPGKIDTGDAPAILDNIRAEIRKNLTAAEFTVIDSEEQVKRLEGLTEEADYSKVTAALEGLGEWLVLGKVDTQISRDGSMNVYHTLMTGKAISVMNRDLLWEGNIDGISRKRQSEPPFSGLRDSAINGGKSFASEVLKNLQTKTLTQERRGSRFEVVFPSAGNYKLERKILKLLKDDIKGLKNVSQKNRGKGDMMVDLYYVGKISDLVDLLLDNFEKDKELKSFSPQIEGNKVIFK